MSSARESGFLTRHVLLLHPMILKGKRVLIVDNRVALFLSHRLPLARALKQAGLEVHVTTLTGGAHERIEAEGFTYHVVTKEKRSNNPLREGHTLVNLIRLYRRLQPELCHHFSLRPVLYGNIASRFVRRAAVIDAITGLGYLFSAHSLTARALRFTFRTGLLVVKRRRSHRFIFQNSDDVRLFQQLGLASEEESTLIKGSGVQMDRFTHEPEPDATPVVLLAARMLRHKGVGEYVEAARRLQKRGVQARFVLAGDHDPDNPSSLSPSRLQAWHEEGVVEWWGHCENMPEVFSRVHIVCLPSYYREGVPRVLIEAASCGRPIVTTDAPGCREIVREGENGLLVPPQDSLALTNALLKLIRNKKMREAMGKRGRAMVEKEFSMQCVLSSTMDVYDELLGAAAPAQDA